QTISLTDAPPQEKKSPRRFFGLSAVARVRKGFWPTPRRRSSAVRNSVIDLVRKNVLLTPHLLPSRATLLIFIGFAVTVFVDLICPGVALTHVEHIFIVSVGSQSRVISGGVYLWEASFFSLRLSLWLFSVKRPD